MSGEVRLAGLWQYSDEYVRREGTWVDELMRLAGEEGSGKKVNIMKKRIRKE